MDTFRKWLNKPKADDKSLLARFYHADRALTAVASELDSFDGRAEPDRCSRLVSRLRQGQDKVLSITNQIMEELLGDERAARVFRSKFPEEVLQENLAGQLWFGAECLAAGSSIMNRELESTAMRPLAQAVTKSLDNVRNLLRDQCLRNNVPNSKTLHLDANDSGTEQLYESLKIFDRLFAEFEFRYVSAMVQVKSKHEYEMQEFICVLFSEALQRALEIGLLEQDQVDAFDPALMFSIPRLAIISGLVVFPKGPLNMDMSADHLSEMFRPFRTILIKIRDLLRTLNDNELFQLEKLLCTNENTNIKPVNVNTSSSSRLSSNSNSQNANCDEVVNTTDNACSNVVNNDDNSSTTTCSSSDTSPIKENLFRKNKLSRNNSRNATEFNVYISSSSQATTPSTSPTAPSSLEDSSDWTDDDSSIKTGDMDETLANADCATGFLVPNTNFGNLLQPHEALLTDNFVASEDELAGGADDEVFHTPKNSSNNNSKTDSGFSTNDTTSPDHTPDSDNQVARNQNLPTNSNVLNNNSEPNIELTSQPSCSQLCSSSVESGQRTIKASSESDTPKTGHHSSSRRSSRNISNRHHHHHHHRYSHSSSSHSSNSSRNHSKKRSKAQPSQQDFLFSKHVAKLQDTSSGDTSSSLSDGDPNEVTMALRAAGRMKYKSTENLLHRLFVCIAGVADQLQTNFASDLRQILRSVFLMNMTPAQEEITIAEKSKESELFEFRASEHDVIQENAGSNQSIYSAAEEANPEFDSVFANGQLPGILQRESSIESARQQAQSARNNIGRSRSLGEEAPNGRSPTADIGRRSIPASLNFRRDRLSSQGTNSAGSNSPINSSGSNSPIGEQSSHFCTAVVTATTNISNNNHIPASNESRLMPPTWVPDNEAPRCMACTIPFTAFRRRHHCRNCGGVFCGVCSSASAQIPKFGFVKAVRVCRDCYVSKIGTT